MFLQQQIGRESQFGIIRSKKIGTDIRMEGDREMGKEPSFHNLKSRDHINGGNNSVEEPIIYSRIPLQAKLSIGQPNDKYEQEADQMADQVMRMPEHGLIQRKCKQCEKEEKLQMKPLASQITQLVQHHPDEELEDKEEIIQPKSDGAVPTVSPSFQSQLNASKGGGSPLPTATNQFMSNAFGTDFSNVRIHDDFAAHKMNKDIHAQAFTNGSDIYFTQGQYSTGSSEGKRLLAHELTHVVQQNGLRRKPIQRITCSNTAATAPARAAAGQPNRLDQRARNIISIASNSQLNNTQKATRLITAIVCHYYPQHSGLVRNISYVANEPGLATNRVGRGRRARGDIDVGNYFITNTTNRGISRRVLQVGHELTHILQYRQGLTGRANKNEREFLAFHENALAEEFVGTGRMSRGTRRNLIDAALGYYYCLSQQKQTQYANQLQQLLTRRRQINQRAGSGPTTVPTSCAHP